MVKNLYTVVGSLFVVFFANGEEKVSSFADVKSFALRIINESDTTAAGRKIRNVIFGIVANGDLDKDLRVGIVEKLKLNLMDSFPFVAALAERNVKTIKGKNLYAMGEEKKLVETLYRSQKEKENFCLDIMLEAARLSQKYAPEIYSSKVVPLMNEMGLEAYL